MGEVNEANLTLAAAARRAGMTIEGIRDAIRRGKLRAEVVATRPVYAIRQWIWKPICGKPRKNREAGHVPDNRRKRKGALDDLCTATFLDNQE